MQLSKPRMALPGEGTTQKRCFLNEKHKSKVQPQPSPFQSDEVLMSEAGRQPAGDGEEEAEALGTQSWDQYTPHCSQGGWKTPPLITHHHQHKKKPAQIKDLQPPGVAVGALVALSLPTLTGPPRSGTCPGLSQERGCVFPAGCTPQPATIFPWLISVRLELGWRWMCGMENVQIYSGCVAGSVSPREGSNDSSSVFLPSFNLGTLFFFFWLFLPRSH